MKKILKIILKNGYDEQHDLPDGASIEELLKNISGKNKFIAAKVNNEITSLSYKVNVNSTVEFLTKEDPFGMEVYRRSLSFLLEKIVNKIFPERKLVICHSLGPGYYFNIDGADLTKEEVELIEKEMINTVKQDLPITREKLSYDDALEHFKKSGRTDKHLLISALNTSKLTIYVCEDFFEVFDLPLANRTGILNVFKLIYYPPGLILQFPKRSNPDKVAPFIEQRRIFNVYQEYRKWGKILKVDNAGGFNEIVAKNEIKNFIQVSEALHSSKISSLANEIYLNKDRVRIVAIAGPSSSGKTTFSKRLSIQLQALGLKPVTISVDNYFIDRDKTPLGEDGRPNYEILEAINIEIFNRHLDSLLKGEEINLLNYNFFTGKSSISGQKLKINKNDIIIIEGIHCLNEKLTYIIPKENKFKIYISVLTQMNIDNNNRIPTTDSRLIRRMVRDNKYRGHSALTTLKMWRSVREGEEKYIFPFQNDADGYFNSALDYETALLKSYAEPLLLQIKPYHEEYSEASRLLKFLSYFLNIHANDILGNSIIREFIGGSTFDY